LFRAAPISPYDKYLLAWVWTNYRDAISQDSALALYDLADILPTRVHVTVPRPFHSSNRLVSRARWLGCQATGSGS
jgi:predicted transcriptional regulator of viral defense system